MSSISIIGRNLISRFLHARPAVWQADAPVSARLAKEKDSVEISSHAKWLGRLHELPPARLQRIVEIRSAIVAGTYETPAKLDAAIGALVNDVVNPR